MIEPDVISWIAVAAGGPVVAAGAVAAGGRITPVARIASIEHLASSNRAFALAACALIAAFAPLALVWLSGPAFLIPSALFVWGGLTLAVVDLSTLRAPRVWSAVYGFTAVGCTAALAPDHAAGAVFVGVAAFALMQAARLAYRRARGCDGLGGGDPWVMAALAAWSGPSGAPWVLALGGGFALVATATNFGGARKELRRLPFAPFLIAASLLLSFVFAATRGAPFWN
ncbi:MAG: hypothetical protein PVI23_12725 [Maricaulaceae bacterium]|jgi:leader peptidase (prepilin peptidase)/N-methyltransferase